MALAMEREPTAYRSILMVAWMVLADHKPVLARLVRGCIALAMLACPLINPAPAMLTPSKAASSAPWHWRWNASQPLW